MIAILKLPKDFKCNTISQLSASIEGYVLVKDMDEAINMCISGCHVELADFLGKLRKKLIQGKYFYKSYLILVF